MFHAPRCRLGRAPVFAGWVVLAASGLAGCGSGGPGTATPAVVRANPADVESTIFLIGDAGAPADDEQVLEALTRQIKDTPAEPVVIFLGDNVYPRGLPDSSDAQRKEMERRLGAQVAVALETKARTFFVPGNHDWDYMGADGWNAIRRQGEFIARRGAPYAALVPGGGCPGPDWADVGSYIRLVMLDTQWWLHDFVRPVDSTSGCATYTSRRVVDSLDGLLKNAAGRQAIVLGHHPLRSGGEHGGHFGRKAYLLPFIPLARKQGISNQDLSGPRNARMRRALETVFHRYQPLVYASGHDHDIQVLDGNSARHFLVSGAGIYGHVTSVTWRSYTRYAAATSGFMRLDVLRDGRVRLGVLAVSRNADVVESFSLYLE